MVTERPLVPDTVFVFTDGAEEYKGLSLESYGTNIPTQSRSAPSRPRTWSGQRKPESAWLAHYAHDCRCPQLRSTTRHHIDRYSAPLGRLF